MIEDYLLQVRKPARYIGGEWNTIKKDPKTCDIKFALCFPDIYELGMSYLGLRILYGLLNEQKDICCERVFAPADDFEKILRDNKIPLFSLENRVPLKEFDIIGFSLTYELNYTNVLNMLDLSGLPLLSKDRTILHPLVIGGGNCTLNPEPVADFFDLFLVGDAEEAILEILEVYRNNRKLDRRELLLEFSNIEGVHVPSFENKKTIKKRVVKDLNTAYFPKNWIVPYIEIVHDRLSLEIARGCPNNCYFCQARVYYWPYRERKVDVLKKQLIDLYNNTGYEEVSLMGLSASDYLNLDNFIGEVYDFCNERKIALSFPSIRANSLVTRLGGLLSKVKKTTITFAPETASLRLRCVLNKNLNIEELKKTSQELFKAGYLHIKLYFMIGIPTETEEELEQIINLSREIFDVGKRVSNKKIFLNLSISNLIPKPHTALQWLAFDNAINLKRKEEYLRVNLKKISSSLKISFHNLETSIIEAVLSRGDRALGRIIYRVWQKGAKFDGWQDHFNFYLWQDSFREENINLDSYLKQRDIRDTLPWDYIDTGLNKQFLINNYKKMFL
ncbi:MAG: TIGR03960 family B12-binding radical SAM protein [Candidatus Omnitrophota bacterium]